MLTLQKFKRKIFNSLVNRGIFISSANKEDEIDQFYQILKPQKDNSLIRVGGEEDGSYVIPDKLEGIKYCFSPGVDKSVKFENALYKKYKIKSFLADNSIDKLPDEGENLNFIKKNIQSYQDESNIEINNWLGNIESNEEYILQMDIEGDEYSTLLSLSRENLNRARVIVLELHYLHLVFSQSGFKIIKPLLKKLTENHTVVFLNPNNNEEIYQGLNRTIPSVLEVTLLRNDYLESNKEIYSYPSKLNIKNNKEKERATLDNRFFI